MARDEPLEGSSRVVRCWYPVKAMPSPLRRSPSRIAFALAFVGLAAASACSEEAAPTTIPEGAVQYHAHVRPVFESRCVGCHKPDGIGPFSMQFDAAEWANGPAPWVKGALDAVATGTMPPWLPAEGCKELAYERRLSPEERETLEAWRDQGLVQGDPATYPGPSANGAAPDLGAPAFELQPAEAYAPREDLTDDYRCFVLPEEFAEETYLTASKVVPEHEAIVHHALLFLIPPANLPAIEKLDAKEAGPGYTCFGGPGGGVLTTLGAWVPGSVPVPTAPGSAMVIPKGSRVVLQMHYNTLALAGSKPPAERSTVHLWTSKEKPERRVELLPMAHLGLEIPSGDAKSVQERTFRLPVDGALVGFAPHMHLLGTRIEASLAPGGAPTADPKETCLVTIPKWDFHWQQSYALPVDGALPVAKGDLLTVRCTYDNSAENQPFLDGKKKMPSTVWWGEGTYDEMCLLFVSMSVPFDTPDFRCGSFESCFESCPTGDSACFFDCATVGGGQCADCLIRGLAQCSLDTCLEPAVAMQKCLQGCLESGPGCLTRTCGKEFDAFYGCAEPKLRNGACGTSTAACGL